MFYYLWHPLAKRWRVVEVGEEVDLAMLRTVNVIHSAN